MTNAGESPLSIVPARLERVSPDGPLSSVRVPSCRDHELQPEVALATGEQCQISLSFQVHPRRDPLERLELKLSGVMRANVAVPISVTFERDHR